MTLLPDDSPPPSDIIDQACSLAASLLKQAHKSRTAEERKEATKMTRLLADSSGKELTFHLADQVFRPPSHRSQAEVFRSLIARHGIPTYLAPHQRFLMRLGSIASRVVPSIVMPAVIQQIRRDAKRVILQREDAPLSNYLNSRENVNLNLLGEAILGEEEAEKRLKANLDLLARPDTSYLSVKISSIFSQINLLDEEGTLTKIQERLRLLYRTGKFINLDMEEYRDLHLTCEAFKRTLDEPEFQSIDAGIVLQAYLPDTFPILRELTEWTMNRPGSIKIRIVKGANLTMEKVEASHHHWPQAPYLTKVEVDANYKRMLNYAFQPEHTKVRIGVASHNLFDIAYALLLRKHHGVEDRIELEMLEGMANEQARVLQKDHTCPLFYAPVVESRDFHSAIAYLVRRLDENTSPANFLTHVFSMTPGDEAWKDQEKRFRKSCELIETVSEGPNRTQDRHDSPTLMDDDFENSPETDWTLPANRTWLTEQIANSPQLKVIDLNGFTDVQAALQTATSSEWCNTTQEERANLLKAAAVKLDEARGKLIAIMRTEACKRPFEGDVEVSEAVDFANYYALRTLDKDYFDGTTARPIGPIVITSPWNFPCAIPCGGILAALAMGNPVIIKPAPETILTALEMVDCLWDAGIPKDALQYLPCPDNEVGQALVSAPEIAAVILTGGSETADLFQSWSPDLKLFAETSGKNALVISAKADPDLAIKDLVRSAFGHAGQKCSAASMALVQAELYDSPQFISQLRDAAASLPVGEASDPAAIVTPIIREANPALLRGLTQLDEGEHWLLEPRQLSPTLWSPGIRMGVKPNSWIHRTELFGPVLSIIRVESMDEALTIQNSSLFGLTGGIHSLDPGEIAHWLENVEVGNAYINRPITGAIVRRQPFGGWKRSCVGPGAKAGGPNYLTQFAHWEESDLPSYEAEISPEVRALAGDDERLLAAAKSYAYWWREEFSKEHDPSQLLGESNHFRYRVAPEVVVSDPTPLHQIAAATVGTKIVSESKHLLAKEHPGTALPNGRLELLHYFNEQAISETTHRHGRV